MHTLEIVGLIALAILPGIIATALLTKNYCIGLTNRRLIVLQVASLVEDTGHRADFHPGVRDCVRGGVAARIRERFARKMRRLRPQSH